MPSAKGTASHTPSMPHICGKIVMPMVKNPKVLKNDKAADILPLDRAVNIADVKIFIPQHKKLYEKIKKPPTAIW